MWRGRLWANATWLVTGGSEFQGSMRAFSRLPFHINDKLSPKDLRRLLEETTVQDLDLLACELPEDAGLQLSWALKKPQCSLRKLAVPADNMSAFQWMMLLIGVRGHSGLTELHIHTTPDST